MKHVSRLVCLVLAAMLTLCIALPASAEEPVVLTLLTCDSSAAIYIDHFNEVNKDIQISVDYVAGTWQETAQKLITLIAAGSPPDLCFMSGVMAADFESQMLDITDRVYAELNMDDFVDGVFDAIKVNGKLYGVPKDMRVTQTWYNKKLFDAYGVEYPSSDWSQAWTVEEWQAVCEKLSGEIDGVKIYGNFIDWRWVRMIPYLLDKGIGTIPFDAEGNPTANSDEFKAVLTMLQDQIKNGVAPAPADLQEAGRGARFNNGTLAMMHTGTWDYGAFYANPDIELAACPTPGGQTNFFIDSWAVFKDSKNPDAAWEACKYFCSEEYWNWVMENDPNVCFPIRKEALEKSKDYLFANLDQASRDCLFQSLEYAVPYVGHTHYTELEVAMNEVTSLLALLELDPDEACEMIQESWLEIVEE